jgi:predicted transcriptional regulator
MSRGEHRYNAKLTDDLVREIRRLHQEGMRGRAIGKAFGLTESAVSAIVRGKAWKHVT